MYRDDILARVPLVRYIPAQDGAPPAFEASLCKAETKQWEEGWIESDLPYIHLDELRSACLFCLEDFEEPRRRDAPSDDGQEVPEPPEPLRQLVCGHVFHKSCLDPWFRDVYYLSCPYCRQAIRIEDLPALPAIPRLEPEPAPEVVDAGHVSQPNVGIEDAS